MSLKDELLRIAKSLKNKLINFTRNNKELFFKRVPNSINLTYNPFSNDSEEKKLYDEFEPLRSSGPLIDTVLEKGKLDLVDFFSLKEKPDDKLFKTIKKIKSLDTSYQNEFGISGAWLFGPFLCWRGKEKYDPFELFVTPLFKIPIDIVGKNTQYKLEIEDSTLKVNHTLRLALQRSWNILLDSEYETETFDSAVKQIIEALQRSGKSVGLADRDTIPALPKAYKDIKNEDGDLIERVHLKIEEALSKEDLELYNATTHLQFQMIDAFVVQNIKASKNVLISDYDSMMDKLHEHSLISSLFGGSPSKRTSVGDKRELNGTAASIRHNVKSIDSSQQKAIHSAAANQVTIIKGPPGTGKTQTITNLIAENLAKDRRILFVAEKRNALDMVYNRLKATNIHEQTVLLHSSDENRKNLYKSFLEMNKDAVIQAEAKWEDHCRKLDQTKSRLVKYRDTLDQLHDKSGLTVRELCGLYSNLRGTSTNFDLLALVDGLKLTDIEHLSEKFNEISDLIARVPDYQKNVWKGRKSNVLPSERLRHDLANWESVLKTTVANIENLESRLKEFLPGLSASRSIALESLAAISQDEATNYNAAFLTLRANRDPILIQSLKQSLIAVQDNLSALKVLKVDSPIEAVNILADYQAIPRGVLKVLTPAYWSARKIKNLYAIDQSKWPSKKDLDSFIELTSGVAELNSILKRYCIAPLKLQQLEDKLPEYLRGIQALEEIQSLQNQGVNFDHFETLFNVTLIANEAKEVFDELSNLTQTTQSILMDVKSLFEENKECAESPTEILDLVRKLKESVEQLTLLDKIAILVNNLKVELPEIDWTKIIEEHLCFVSDQWTEVLKENLVKKWFEEVKQNYEQIRAFNSPSIDKWLQQYKNFEKEHLILASERVNALSAKHRVPVDPVSLQPLKKQVSNKKRFKPPRQVMEEGAMPAMLKLKPCWMMSPLSISQVLPQEKEIFDVVIFDEASQVKVEDALPSIYRGKKLIVVGDNEQMPPTSFFEVDTDDDDDEYLDDELGESILDLALKNCPEELLNWHYRSRHEALIAFSNVAFYGGALVTPPNPYELSENNPFTFKDVQNAFYKSKIGNPSEAKHVIEFVSNHLLSGGTPSIGVIAFGKDQERALIKAQEDLAENNSKFASAWEEALSHKDDGAFAGPFIKNLENVQGDERDIIILSVGYAANPRTGKLRLGFGPLTTRGGYRRLNVAITRAKEQMVVFCSFDPEQIPTDEAAYGKSYDNTCFGRFLKYAKALSQQNVKQAKEILNSFPLTGRLTRRFSSKFAQDVKRSIEQELGFHVAQEIGTGGKFIDLAIEHPNHKRHYILGIEVDGTFWHSDPHSIDHDVIRDSLLEARGWNLIRIKEQDWAENRSGELERIKSEVSRLLNTPKEAA